MTSAFDQRIVKLGLEVDGETTVFDGLAIEARGRKFGSATSNQCEARIFNLSRDARNYIITNTSPLKTPRTPARMTLDVGRESYGTFRLFEGDVIFGSVLQPPDIGVSLQSLTSNFFQGVINGYSGAQLQPLRAICGAVANSMGLSLEFHATDRQIENYSFTGSKLKQVEKLEQMGGVDCFIDNNKLVVLDSNTAKPGDAVVISAETGMVGVPQVSYTGVYVRVMINSAIELGGKVTIESKINPAANGTYIVKQINFDVANRDAPFWYNLACISINSPAGAVFAG